MSMLPQHFLDNTFADFERWNQRPLWLWWHLIVDYEWFQRRGFVSNFLSFNFWWQSWRTELEQIGQNFGLPAALEAFNPLTIFNRYFLQLSTMPSSQNRLHWTSIGQAAEAGSWTDVVSQDFVPILPNCRISVSNSSAKGFGGELLIEMSNQLKIVWGSCLPSLVDEVEIFCGNPSVSLHCSSKLSARLLPQQVFSPTKNTARPTRHRNESGCSSLTRCLSAPIFARSLLIAYLSLPKYSCQCSWNFQDQGNWQAERSTRSTETSWKSGITRLLTSSTFRCISWISFHLECCKVQAGQPGMLSVCIDLLIQCLDVHD